MSRHDFSPEQELTAEDPEALRSALMRSAAHLTESGHKLNPQNLEGVSRKDAIDHMLETVGDITRIAGAIAAQAIRQTPEVLPEPVKSELKSAS